MPDNNTPRTLDRERAEETPAPIPPETLSEAPRKRRIDTVERIDDTTFRVRATEADVEYGDRDKTNFEPSLRIRKLNREVKISFKTGRRVSQERPARMEVEYQNGMIVRMVAMK